MNYAFFGKPVGLVAGARPFVIGPGFATYPALGATYSKGFAKAVPVTRVAISPWGFGRYGIV